ncbi:hypothetical protein PHLGIDRAFT_18739 [Phlebiopsis gigantea 11061_1 CR5-6]|uniref:Ribosomal protein S21 n=1 Tax=Phlebiopsis gigantea (strain 11061_1 CR5-6) TaxID=745531 RepID=A0A0C3S1S3_PHLG1|nr:hypothetical protein PHLGIDRAFT_18739 [Phlebiopsis gigantea 11061_1 CR5-6]
MSQIELRDARDPNTWLHVQTLQKTASDMTAQEAWARREARVSILDPPQSTWSGRSVPVNQQEPLHSAFSRLSKIMNRNNVPRELFLTRRHEKKGVKRRRLVSVRWRRRFAHEVRKKVQLVKEIRARGA